MLRFFGGEQLSGLTKITFQPIRSSQRVLYFLAIKWVSIFKCQALFTTRVPVCERRQSSDQYRQKKEKKVKVLRCISPPRVGHPLTLGQIFKDPVFSGPPGVLLRSLFQGQTIEWLKHAEVFPKNMQRRDHR